MLFTPEELQSLMDLLNRVPKSHPEALWAQGFMTRLVQFCTPPKVEEKIDEDIDGE